MASIELRDPGQLLPTQGPDLKPQILQESPVHRENLIVEDDVRRHPGDLQLKRLVEKIGVMEVNPDVGVRYTDHA